MRFAEIFLGKLDDDDAQEDADRSYAVNRPAFSALVYFWATGWKAADSQNKVVKKYK